MIFLVFLVLGCNSIKGIQEAREKANQEGRMIMENIDRYAEEAERTAQRAERACFSFMREFLQKSRSGETESDRQAEKEQVNEGRE